MDYKPPSTIAALITPPILDKYRRVFNFLIRVLRGKRHPLSVRVRLLTIFTVDSVARLLYRSTRSGRSGPAPPAFFNTPSAQKRLNHFIFEANSFMHTLSAYITDTAIGANHAAFIERLTKLRYGVQEHNRLSQSIDEASHVDDIYGDREPPLSDVFSIMEYHARVMDRILEACFLKTRHQGVGGTSLIECMDTILRVGKLVMDLRSGRLKDEAHGERKLNILVERFQVCVRNLVRLVE